MPLTCKLPGQSLLVWGFFEVLEGLLIPLWAHLPVIPAHAIDVLQLLKGHTSVSSLQFSPGPCPDCCPGDTETLQQLFGK